MATSDALQPSVKSRLRDTGAFVKQAQEQSRLDAVEITAFHDRITRLRVVSSDSGEEKEDGPQMTARLRRQESELVLALEELRAQHANLREAHALLEDEHARYVELFDSAPDAFVTTDVRGLIRAGNGAAALLLGVPPDVLRRPRPLIGFVVRQDTRRFRDHLGASGKSPGRHSFSLRMRARGGMPFAASLSVRTVLRGGDDSLELHWTIRPAHESAPEQEQEVLADVAREVRAALAVGSPRLTSLAEDLEHLSRASADGVERSAVTPAWLVARAVERVVSARPDAGASIDVGTVEDGVSVSVEPERSTWALARLFELVAKAKVSGRRSGSSFVLEVRAWAPCDLASQLLAQSAIRASFGADGGMLRVSAPGEDYAWPICEITLPLSAR